MKVGLRRQRPTIYVFLNKKLVTCDAIIPILLDIRERHESCRCRFICLEPKTLETIRANVVLWDAMQILGSTTYVDRGKSVLGWAKRKLEMIALILRVSVAARFRRSSILHFGVLDPWPLRFAYLVNRRRTWYVESVGVGYSPTEFAVDNLDKQRSVPQVTAAGALLAFSPEWRAFKNKRLSQKPRFVVGYPHLRSAWLRYVDEVADRYLLESNASFGDRKIIAIMLGQLSTMAKLATQDALPVLLEETLEVLAPLSEEYAVVLKPHAITNLEALETILARHRGNFIVSYLHPSVLAARAKVFICNFYSTTLTNARFAGVPTIEYSHYSPAMLGITQGSSVRPDFVDYFINKDQERLREIVHQLLEGRRMRRPSSIDLNPTDALGMIALGVAQPASD